MRTAWIAIVHIPWHAWGTREWTARNISGVGGSGPRAPKPPHLGRNHYFVCLLSLFYFWFYPMFFYILFFLFYHSILLCRTQIWNNNRKKKKYTINYNSKNYPENLQIEWNKKETNNKTTMSFLFSELHTDKHRITTKQN